MAAKEPESTASAVDDEIRAAARSAKIEVLKAISRYALEASSSANVKDLAIAYAAVMGNAGPVRPDVPPGPPFPLRPSRQDWPA